MVTLLKSNQITKEIKNNSKGIAVYFGTRHNTGLKSCLNKDELDLDGGKHERDSASFAYLCGGRQAKSKGAKMTPCKQRAGWC